jgi:hypothetical protein
MPVKKFQSFINEELSDLSIVPKEIAAGDLSPEQEMAISQLKSMIDHASELINLVGNVKDLEAWVQSKITMADDYIETVHSYMNGRLDMKDLNPK